MVLSSGDPNDFLSGEHPAHFNEHRYVPVCSGSVSQFSRTVGPPGRDGAIRAQRKALYTSSGDPNDFLFRESPAHFHQYGYVSVCSGSVSQFSKIVGPPGRDGAIRTQRQAMFVSSGDLNDFLSEKDPIFINPHRNRPESDVE